MTNEDAIQFLDNIKHEEAGRAIGKEGFYRDLMGYHIQALDMSIAALKAQPCEDAVSRQTMLDGLASIAKAKAKSDAQRALMGRVMFFTEQLPPVTSKPRTGKWILHGLGYRCSEFLIYLLWEQWLAMTQRFIWSRIKNGRSK